MAFVTIPPQLPANFLWHHIPAAEINQLARQPSQRSLWNDGTNHALVECETAKHGLLTQSATQLNCYDNLSLNISAHPMQNRMRAQLQYAQQAHPLEMAQHRSMIDLDTTFQPNFNQRNFRDTPHRQEPMDTRVTIKWLQNDSTLISKNNGHAKVSSSSVTRFTIQDLIQQQSTMTPVSYPVDLPSILVRVECKKHGCRCVLKNEPAMALKIVPNVSLVHGSWIFPKIMSRSYWRPQRPQILGHISKFGHNEPDRTTYPNSVSNERPFDCNSASPLSIIITNCCPAWFELINKNPSLSTDTGSFDCSDLPLWSSCKALWRARPDYFLIRKQTACMLACNTQPVIDNSTDDTKQRNLVLNVDADNVVNLKPGTILRLINCRLCRLIRRPDLTQDTHISVSLLGRNRIKTVSMLQCAITGDRALSAIAAASSDIPPQDVLSCLADGPRLIYIPLDSKTVLCSPVASRVSYHEPVERGCKVQSQLSERSMSHSLISLLTNYRLPIVTRPIVGLRPDDGIADEKTYQSEIPHSDPNACPKEACFRLNCCYHGDLIFLEPIADCQKLTQDSLSKSTQNSQRTNHSSRFFVVTTDMLNYHNFFVAESSSAAIFNHELKVHASRVSHFLAAAHSMESLQYLFKHLEDVTQSSNTGPSHVPLSRTLGPVDSCFEYGKMQELIASVAATAAIASEDKDDFSHNPSYALELRNEPRPSHSQRWNVSPFGSGCVQYQSATCLSDSKGLMQSSITSSLFASEVEQMNALCDEIEDIYYYVRNGHLPTQSKSMTSLTQHISPPLRSERVPQVSAPISPKHCDMKQANSRMPVRSPLLNGGMWDCWGKQFHIKNRFATEPTEQAPIPYAYKHKLNCSPENRITLDPHTSTAIPIICDNQNRLQEKKNRSVPNISTNPNEKPVSLNFPIRLLQRDLSQVDVNQQKMCTPTTQPSIKPQLHINSTINKCSKEPRWYTNTKVLHMSRTPNFTANAQNQLYPSINPDSFQMDTPAANGLHGFRNTTSGLHDASVDQSCHKLSPPPHSPRSTQFLVATPSTTQCPPIMVRSMNWDSGCTTVQEPQAMTLRPAMGVKSSQHKHQCGMQYSLAQQTTSPLRTIDLRQTYPNETNYRVTVKPCTPVHMELSNTQQSHKVDTGSTNTPNKEQCFGLKTECRDGGFTLASEYVPAINSNRPHDSYHLAQSCPTHAHVYKDASVGNIVFAGSVPQYIGFTQPPSSIQQCIHERDLIHSLHTREPNLFSQQQIPMNNSRPDHTNSSPDTGIGIESNIDVNTTNPSILFTPTATWTGTDCVCTNRQPKQLSQQQMILRMPIFQSR